MIFYFIPLLVFQGAIQFKDFDISKEASGVERAIETKFNATISESYLGIHLFRADNGTCCNSIQGYYGPSISVMSIVSCSIFE